MEKTCIICKKIKPSKMVAYKGPKCNACARAEYRIKNPHKAKEYYNSKKDDPEFKAKRSVQWKTWSANLSEEKKEKRQLYKKEKDAELYLKYKNDPKYKKNTEIPRLNKLIAGVIIVSMTAEAKYI